MCPVSGAAVILRVPHRICCGDPPDLPATTSTGANGLLYITIWVAADPHAAMAGVAFMAMFDFILSPSVALRAVTPREQAPRAAGRQR